MNVPFYFEGIPASAWKVEAWQYDELCLEPLIALLKNA